jgi:hypothetical protein
LSNSAAFLNFWKQHIFLNIQKGRKVSYPFSECLQCLCKTGVCDFAWATIGLYFIYKCILHGTANDQRLYPTDYKRKFSLTKISAHFAIKYAHSPNPWYNAVSLGSRFPTFRRTVICLSSQVSELYVVEHYRPETMTQTLRYIPDERALNNIIIGHERQFVLLNKRTREHKSYLKYKMARILADFFKI